MLGWCWNENSNECRALQMSSVRYPNKRLKQRTCFGCFTYFRKKKKKINTSKQTQQQALTVQRRLTACAILFRRFSLFYKASSSTKSFVDCLLWQIFNPTQILKCANRNEKLLLKCRLVCQMYASASYLLPYVTTNEFASLAKPKSINQLHMTTKWEKREGDDKRMFLEGFYWNYMLYGIQFLIRCWSLFEYQTLWIF